MAYTGDTTLDSRIVKLLAGADAALMDAAFTRETLPPNPAHLWAEQCGRYAREAGVGRLLLSHIHPLADEAVEMCIRDRFLVDQRIVAQSQQVENFAATMGRTVFDRDAGAMYDAAVSQGKKMSGRVLILDTAGTVLALSLIHI